MELINIGKEPVEIILVRK